MNYIKSYKFNPKTGNPLNIIDNNSLVDDLTQEIVYLNPKPAVSGIIRYKNQVILTTRAIDPNKGCLDLPGGFVNIDETLEQAILREIDEELNIILKDPKYFGSFYGEYLFENVNHPILDVVFTLEINDIDNIKVADDVSDFHLFDMKSIPLDDIPMKTVKNALSLLQSKIN